MTVSVVVEKEQSASVLPTPTPTHFWFPLWCVPCAEESPGFCLYWIHLHVDYTCTFSLYLFLLSISSCARLAHARLRSKSINKKYNNTSLLV